MKTRLFAAFIAIVLLVNMFLLAFRIINFTIFWLVLIAGAIIAYKILPRLKT